MNAAVMKLIKKFADFWKIFSKIKLPVQFENNKKIL